MLGAGKNMLEDAAGRPSILIGITGHRDPLPEDVPTLTARIGSELEKLVGAYSPAPFVAISPLAEGADRLFAGEALRQQIPLLVVLPMRRDLFEIDFDTQAARDEFRDLLDQASLVVELPVEHGLTEAQITQPGSARDRQYESANRWMASRAHVLFALWNGKNNGLVGGTASVVDAFLKGADAASGSGGLLVHILTRRLSSPDCDGVPCEVRLRTTERWAAVGYTHVLERIRDFNLDLNRLGEQGNSLAAASMNDFIPEKFRTGLSSRAIRLLHAYSLADAVAIKAKQQWLPLLLRLVGLSFLAFGAYEVHAHLAQNHPEVLLLALGFLAAAWLLWRKYEKKGRIQDRFLDYRAFAEGLRVQFIWTVSGIEKDASAAFHRHDSRELDWIWHAVSSINGLGVALDVGAGIPGSANCDVVPALVKECWIQGQGGYFKRAAANEKAKEQRLSRAMKQVFGAAVIVLAAMTAVGFLFKPVLGLLGLDAVIIMEHLEHLHVYEYMILAVGIPFLAAAMIEYLRGRLSYDEHVRQYQRMAVAFSQALDEIEGDCDPVSQCVVLEKLGREALEENADWVLTHRTRPLEPPPP